MWAALLALCGLLLPVPSNASPAYRVLGPPTLADAGLESRCPDIDPHINFRTADGSDAYGPSGIAVDPRGRIYVTDSGGRRVLTWPDVDGLESCQPADGVIGAGILSGPESVAIHAPLGMLFVADPPSHTVQGYRRTAAGAWTCVVTLGTPGVTGDASNQSFSPRVMTATNQRGRVVVGFSANCRASRIGQELAGGHGCRLRGACALGRWVARTWPKWPAPKWNVHQPSA